MAKLKGAALSAKMTGLGEPDVTKIQDGQPDYEARIGDAYNWARIMIEPADLKRMTLEVLKGMGRDVSILQRAHDWNFASIGKAAWVTMGGGKLSEHSMNYFLGKIQEIEDRYAAKVAVSDEAAAPAPKLTAAEKVKRTTDQLIADLDVVIDQEQWDVDLKKVLSERTVDPQVIRDYYKGLAVELTLVGKDPQVTEGYRSMSAARRKAMMTWLLKLMTELDGVAAKPKAPVQRKISVRPRKVKTAVEQVRKLKYQKSAPDLEVESLPGSHIPGAKTAVLYNTKRRKLEVYYARPNGVFMVKGSKILDYDPTNSFKVALRKPKEQLAQVKAAGGVRQLEAFLKTIKGVRTQLKGKVNEQTMIIKSFK